MDRDENYKKSLEVLKESYPEILEKVKKHKAEFEVGDELSPDERLVPYVTTKTGKKYMLNGFFGEQERIEKKLEEWGKLPHSVPLFFYGMANYHFIKEVLEKTDDKCIIFIYEPSIEIFQYYMRTVDLKDFLQEHPIYLAVGKYKDPELESRIFALFQIDTISSFRVEVAPNYAELFSDNLKAVAKLVDKKFKDFMVGWRTAEEFSDTVGHNMMYNIYHMLHAHDVIQLQGILKGEIPAIIVSAGPSLNKNIDDLKKAVGKACIIAVDTAIKPLLNHGIKPDFFVIVDGKKPTELMDHPRISEIPLVTCTVVARGIMDLHKGKKFFYAAAETFEDDIWGECIKSSLHRNTMLVTTLATGGSVANTAFSLANFMKAKTLILVGQDLALTNGRTHADGTFKEKMDKLTQDEYEDTLEVEGIRGNKVITRRDFARYLRWFEEYIERQGIKNAVDATQGGAKIHGTKIMTLKKAIEQYCDKDFCMKDELEKLPEMMDYPAKLKFAELYKDLPNGMEKVVKNAKKSIRLYKKMKKLAEAEELDSEALLKLSKQLTKVNDFMNNDTCALFIQATLVKVNFTIRMGIYQEEDDEKENLISMAQHGITMNQYILYSALYWKDETKKIVEERPAKVTEDDVYYPLDYVIRELEQRRVK
ncbi:MAG: motility associated factor glycosyltransferase family protein [Lachnospiraceae bacterium]|nr:motility associated factor glycosyltransferase family protein [Lachnospiraceae bacterium]